MKKIIYITILFIIFQFTEKIYAQQTLAELLKEYKEVADYAQKTRIESLGHVIVFTREDIENMQAEKLSDLLHYLKVGWGVPNRFGVENLSFQGTSTGISTFVRLYINDHEVSSVHTGSPFLTYDNYPLDHIDHVEIYYASGAIRLGDEPATVIIKLYTQKPERENAVTLRGTVSNTKSYDTSFVDAREVKSYLSYLIMLNKGYFNYDTQYINDQPVYRNLWKSYLYLGLNYYRTFLELSFAKINRNIFQGLSLDGAPEEGKTKSLEYYISITQYLLNDKSLKLNLTLDGQNRKYYEKNKEGILIPRIINWNNTDTIPVEYREDIELHKYTLNLTKEFKSNNNLLLTGFTIKDKRYHINDREYKTSSYTEKNVKFIEFDRETLLSFILEDQYNITDKNLIILSLKADKYFRKKEEDLFDYMAKIGFITFFNRNWMIKTYLGRAYFAPTFLDFEMSTDKLKSSTTKSILAEIIYQNKNHYVSIFGGYQKAYDPILPDPSRGIIVNGDKQDYKAIAITYEYRINSYINLSTGYSRTDTSLRPYLLPKESGYIRVTGRKGKISYYTELIYRKSFNVRSIHIPDSYDLNGGISYLINDNFSLKIKGTNILNKGTRIPVIPLTGTSSTYDSMDRKYFISLEVSY
ncbi:TonB-dependent receptor plug domain-containing protein [Persephonella sp.]